MFSLQIAIFALLLLSQVMPSFGAGLPRGGGARGEESGGVIEALLRTPNLSSGSGLQGRQSGTCAAGYLACSDGNGCCPYGKYCGVWSGKLGCCTIGKTCVANSNPCDYQGDLPCAGEDFCCPAGDICYRDTAGVARCRTPGADTFTNTFTNTFTDTEFDTSTSIPQNTITDIPTTTDLFPTTTSLFPTTTRTTIRPITTAASGPPSTTQNSFDFPGLGNGASSASTASIFLIFAGLVANLANVGGA